MRSGAGKEDKLNLISIISLLVSEIIMLALIKICYFDLKANLETSRILNVGYRKMGTISRMGDYGYEDHNYYINYTFVTEYGESFAKAIYVTDLLYEKSNQGDLIEIAYDPVNPSKNFPVELKPELWQVIFSTVVKFIPIVFFGKIFFEVIQVILHSGGETSRQLYLQKVD